MEKIYFISRDANWQHYRNEILNYLGQKKNLKIEILTTGEIKNYLKESDVLKYKKFKNLFPNNKKINLFPGALLYIIKSKPKCVIGQNNSLNVTEYLALVLCRILGIKYIWWTRGLEHKPLKNNFWRTIRQNYVNFFLRRADRVIVYSKIGYEFLVNIGISSSKIFLAYNTLDTKKLQKIKSDIGQNFDRDKFIKTNIENAKSESKFLLFVGRINKYKKIQNLILSMEKILKVDPNIHLIVIGDGNERVNCENLVRKLQLEKYITFKGAIFDEEIVNNYFYLADLYSIPGSVGLGIVHAFCFGLPIITEKLDYHSAEIQYLKDDVNGYFVEEDNIDQLAEKITKILGNKELLTYLQLEATKTVNNEANIDKMIEQYYRAIIE